MNIAVISRIVVLLPCLLAASSARAQLTTGTQTVNTDTGNGLSVTVDTRWPGGHGYRPVRIEVRSLVPVTNDRNLLVELHCSSLYNETGTFDVSQFIELPAGVDQVQATVALPEHFLVGSFACDIHEDGRFRRALSIKKGPAWGTNYQGWEESVPAVLIVGDQPPDSSVWVQLFPNSVNARAMQGQVLPMGVYPYPGALTLAEAQLPRRWIDYSGIDIVVLALPQAESLAAKHQEAWSAIRRWTAVGGNLWVTGVGNEWQGLTKLEQLLGLPELPAAETPADPGPNRRGWTAPNRAGRSHVLVGMNNDQQVIYSTGAATVDTKPADVPPPQPQSDAIPPHFLSRRLAMGLVIAIADEQPFPGDIERWGWVFNHVAPSRYLWARRHGLSLQGDNPDFWNWFINGVGLAPVGTFTALISLFVIVIGPVNYWWLRRRGKLHLMLVTVPVCAFFVTTALFGYGLIADGLSVRTRFRSYTEIDQPRGEAVCWARSCYYAALAPSGGLLMPDDVLVLPYEDISQFTSYTPHVQRTLDWTDEGQRLTSGWLPARNQTQYITLRARATPAKLVIAPAQGEPAGWSVENQLGTRVSRLLVIAPDGSSWKAADLGMDGKASLETADLEAEIRDLQAAIKENGKSSLPAEIRADELVASRRGYRYYNRFGYYGNNSETRLSGGRLEMSISEATQTEPRVNAAPPADGTIPAKGGPQLKQIGPRMYVALVDHSPEVAVGVPDAVEEDSLHVIVGRW